MRLSSLLYLASLAAAAPATTQKRAEPAALIQPRGEADVIPGQFIIRMKETAEISIAAAKYKARHVYASSGLRGFAATLDDEALEEVEYVEQDQVIHMYEYLSQEDAPWGLSRISHQANGATNYVYDSSAGQGACVYVIDTGIKVDHEQFEGRAEWLMNFTDDGEDFDGAGHGTWVAGLVASRDYGVAKQSQVFALKVFRSDGTTDGASIIAAMDYVVQDAPTRDCPAGHVANMSLGGGFSQTSNDAADAMVNAGVFVAVAAGNSNVDAGQTSPASAPLVCTVGASDSSDVRADFSSYGSVVDVFAPGVDLESTSYQDGSTTASGTSGASPLVAGLGAYLMAFEGNPGSLELCQRIKDLATYDVLQDIPEGTVNALAFNGAPQ